ncbi:Bug family tripartite tricarboxylate transporter substrate binding protein [Sinorhizobium meliloti]|nr:tripartite tricarboxylate transporter substrate binding protein [Sinorhizobium meliloti]
MTRRTVLVGGATAMGLAMLGKSASAQSFTKPIEIVVGQPPGGGTDTYARAIASALTPFLDGQAAVVVNRPGGNAVLAIESVMSSRPDGYTLSMTSGGTAVIKRIWDGNGPDIATDMRPVATIGMYASCVVVRKDSPHQNINSWIEEVKASQRPVLWGHTGRGSIHHIAGQALLSEYGLPTRDVPFQGAPDARNALVNGEVEFAVFGTQNLTGFEEQVRTIGILSTDRDPFVEGGKTIIEQGVRAPLFFTPIILHAPKDTPDDVIAKLENAVRQATESEEYKKLTGTAALVVYFRSADETQSWTKTATEEWRPVIEQVKQQNAG